MITILCSGSRGDFQPYIALAQELQKLGKTVRIAGGKSFEDFIKNYGIDFYPLSADYQSAEIDPKLLQDAQSSDNPLKMILTFNKIKKYVLGLTAKMFAACQGSELIVYHPGCTIGYFAGAKLGIPAILAAPFPMHKTTEVASLIAYGKTIMPKAVSYQLLQGMLWMAGKTGIETFFKKEYGKLPENFGSPFEKIDHAHPAIISCSNFVFPRPLDWNADIHQNGYWFVTEKDDYTPPKNWRTSWQRAKNQFISALAAFLTADIRLRRSPSLSRPFGEPVSAGSSLVWVQLTTCRKTCWRLTVFPTVGCLSGFPWFVIMVVPAPPPLVLKPVSQVSSCHFPMTNLPGLTDPMTWELAQSRFTVSI